jgi:hypothetical protein
MRKSSSFVVFMRFLRGLKSSAAPGVSIAGAVSICPVGRFIFNTESPLSDVEISTIRKPVLLMKWKRAPKLDNTGRLMVGWIRPASC